MSKEAPLDGSGMMIKGGGGQAAKVMSQRVGERCGRRSGVCMKMQNSTERESDVANWMYSRQELLRSELLCVDECRGRGMRSAISVACICGCRDG